MGNRVNFPRIKQLGSGVDLPHPFSVKVKERD
jgi:hypothetical protein